MSVSISNTNLSDSFNTWRLNTNLLATTVANNAVTVNPGGDSNRGGLATGNGHVIGTFSATTLKATTIAGGNTTNDAALTISSNTTFSGSLAVSGAAEFSGNVIMNQVGQDVLDLGGVSYWRWTGGSAGQYLRFTTGGTADLKSLTFRDISDLTSNSAHITLSGANTSFAQTPGETPHLIFSNANDSIEMYAANGAGATGYSDLFVKLTDNAAESKLIITNSVNTAMMTVNSQGHITANNFSTASGAALATQDDAVALAIALG